MKRTIALFLSLVVMFASIPSALAADVAQEEIILSIDELLKNPMIEELPEKEVLGNGLDELERPEQKIVISEDVGTNRFDLESMPFPGKISKGAFSARGGNYQINPNTTYSLPALTSASDYYMLMVNLPSGFHDVTACLDLPTYMNYDLQMAIYNSGQSQVRFTESNLPASLGIGQRARVSGESNGFAVVMITSMDGAVHNGKTFTVTVNTTTINDSQRDQYEINDQLFDTLYGTDFSSRTISAGMDNSRDTDFYLLNFSTSTGQSPIFQITSGFAMEGVVFEVNGSNLNLVGYFSNGSAVSLPQSDMSFSQQYCVGVYAVSGATGSYQLKTQKQEKVIDYARIINYIPRGDRGFKNFNSGTQPLVQYWLEANFTVADRSNEPIPNGKAVIRIYHKSTLIYQQLHEAWTGGAIRFYKSWEAPQGSVNGLLWPWDYTGTDSQYYYQYANGRLEIEPWYDGVTDKINQQIYFYGGSYPR